MKLTEAGQTLYRQSRSLFLNLRRVEENVRSIGAGEGGRINVGVIYSAMPYALHYLEAYHARYPKVEFYIRLGSPQDLLNDLDRGELHVLFLRRSTQESGSLHERILGEDALELIMTAATDPAPELDAVPIERLRGVPMCLLRSDDLWGYNDYLMKECRRSGCQRRRKGPQPVHRQHRAQHHEHQRRRVVRQDTGLPGADDLAHGRSPFPGQVPLIVPIIQPFAKNASGFMKNLQLGNYLVIQSASAVPHTCRSISGRQTALAGLVLGSLTAARPVTGCRYFV